MTKDDLFFFVLPPALLAAAQIVKSVLDAIFNWLWLVW